MNNVTVRMAKWTLYTSSGRDAIACRSTDVSEQFVNDYHNLLSYSGMERWWKSNHLIFLTEEKKMLKIYFDVLSINIRYSLA